MPRLRFVAPLLRIIGLLIAIAACLPVSQLSAAPAQERPTLSLPIPMGETWRILQGYGCGTHNTWNRYSLDLVNTDGRTKGAPVRAAADGVVLVWVPKNGTLILHHGNGFYTEYTHMSSATNTTVGAFFHRGDQIGIVGERGTPGLPHLHFTAFTSPNASARHRKSVPLQFMEGYDLPEIGGCDQHDGKTLHASETPPEQNQDHTAPTIVPLAAPVPATVNTPVTIQWQPGQDDNSGVAGYRLYIGPDPDGKSDWFTTDPQVDLPGLAAGTYLLRIQVLDGAGNANDWATIGQIIVQ